MRPVYRATLTFVSILFGGILFPACTICSVPESNTPSAVDLSLGATKGVDMPGNPGIPPEDISPKSSPISSIPFEPLSFSAPDCDYGGTFKTIEAVDQYTVRFVLCKPEVAFLPKIAFPTFGIQPREWLEQTGGGGLGSMLLEKPVGTGPFKVGKWLRGEELVFEAFDNYWGLRKSKISSLVFRWKLDSTDRLVELQAGTVDGIDNVSSTDFPTILNDPKLTLVPRLPISVSYLGMNNTYSPFDNEKVRQAIAMAINRGEIVDSVLPEGYAVASHFTPCIIPNGCVGETWYKYDPVRAKELLVKAGFPNGFQTELAYRDVVRGYLPWPSSVAESIRDQLWKNLNISVRLRKMQEKDFYDAIDAGTYPGLYLLGWGADFPDVTDFLDLHFGLDANRQFGGKFPDIVDALNNGGKLSSDDARLPYYEAANNAIKHHVPMVPISYGGWISPDSLAVAYKRDVQGAHASPLGLENFSSISFSSQTTFTWMQSAEPLSLYCPDETDIETWRACAQVTESLYRFSVGGASVEPALAEICQSNGENTVWTCKLRKNVVFHDGSLLDADDVVMSISVLWDASNPLHKGNMGTFAYFKEFWGDFMNASYP